jgi:hypothetical protein
MNAIRSPLAGLLPDLFGERAQGDARNTVEQGTPGEVRFDGLLAGLFGRTGSGDRNDPSNYVLFCPSCGAALGTCSRWKPDKGGTRAVGCPICMTTVFLDACFKPVAMMPTASYLTQLERLRLKNMAESAYARVEEAEREWRDRDDEKGANDDW